MTRMMWEGGANWRTATFGFRRLLCSVIQSF